MSSKNLNTKGTADSGSPIADPDDSIVTMVDYLANERMSQEKYDAVLGASDEKACTYTKGAIKRQALYSCLTCCPEGRYNLSKCAGVCLACSLHCHVGHDLVELYTKRNFRCDCPTERFDDNHCIMNLGLGERQPPNENNIYDQNFQGIYCKCKRPYPDPDRANEGAMLQCSICEDWYHLEHIKAPRNALTLSEVATEMICDTCMEQHKFLRDYAGISLNMLENADETLDEIENEEKKLRCDLDKSISDILIKAHEDKEQPRNSSESVAANDRNDRVASTSTVSGINNSTKTKRKMLGEEPNSKRMKLDNEAEKSEQENAVEERIKLDNKAEKTEQEKAVEENNVEKEKCRRPTKALNIDADECGGDATFWDLKFRTSLCQCHTCMCMYKEQQVEYLIDIEDSTKSYEERGVLRASEELSTYDQGIRALANMNRVQQVNVITEYNHMQDQLKEFLATFVAENRVVTEEDINSFFARIHTKRAADAQRKDFC